MSSEDVVENLRLLSLYKNHVKTKIKNVFKFQESDLVCG